MSTIYNPQPHQHRTLQPTGGPPPTAVPLNRPRLDDSLDVIRQEFEYMSQEVTAMRSQRDEYEAKISSQVNELNIIRQSLYDLETQHEKIRRHYEEEVSRARAESRAAAAAVAQAAAASSSSGPSQAQPGPAPPPGVVGPGGPPPGASSSSTTTAPSGPTGTGPPPSTGPAPPPPPGLGVGVGGPPGLAASGPGAPAGMYPDYFTNSAVPDSAREREMRERERDRDMRDRDRDGRDRDRGGDRGRDRERERGGLGGAGGVIVDRDVIMRDPREQQQRDARMGGPPISGGMGMNPMGGPGGPVMSDRERDLMQRDRDRVDRERLGERDLRERDRDRDRDRDRALDRGERERDRDRLPDSRDPKRLKSERDRVKTSNTAAVADRTGPSDHFSPSLGHAHYTPKLPPHPPATGLSGIGSGPPPPGMGGPGLPPQQQGQAPGGGGTYPPAEGNSLGLIPLSGPGGSGPSQGGPSNPPANPASSSQAIITSQQQGTPGPPSALSFPDEVDIHTISPEHKREGGDWFALFNHKVKRVLDVNLVHTLMHESVVCCVRFSADGKFLATGCNRTAQIYDAKSGVKTCILADDSAGKAGDLYIRSVCFSPDGKCLATGAEDKKIRIWDIAKKRIRNVFDGHQQEIYSLDFSLDGRLIVSGSGDKTARIWDMLEGTSKVLTINDPDSLNNDAGVTSVAISPDGRYVAAGSLDTVVRIWDVNSGALVERLRGHRDSVYSVAFTPDGKGLVSGSLDKTLKYWDVSGLALGPTSGKGVKKEGGGNNAGRKDVEKGSQCLMNFTGHKDYVLSVAVSHDGQWVVSGSKDRGVQFWDARNAVVQCMLQGHKNSVISIDLSPAGNFLATGSGDWQARIWNYGNMNG